jgi:hypothetical protein
VHDRFNSSLAHSDVWLDDYVKSLLTRTFVLGSCGPLWTDVALSSHSFPTYSPRQPSRGEWAHRFVRPPMSTVQPWRPLRSVTGGPLHG